jgi:tRNA dimethylallyltransferase
MEPVSFKSKKFLIIIAGPTASGKTALALSVAGKYKCDIFSADSRQIYKGMNIGTAKPSKEELERVRHHFIDYKDLTESYDVGQYVEDLHRELTSYFTHHDVAVMAGGTGLYIQSFLHGLDDFPEIPNEVTDRINSVYRERGISALQAWLKELDPDYYQKVDVHNPRRLIRSLAVCLTSGRPYSSFLNDNRDRPERPYNILPVLLNPNRNELYSRINKRVDDMIHNGLLKEVSSLYENRHLRSLDTVGYKELFQYIDNEMTLDQAIEKIKINTRRYAKRQMTWFKKYGHWHTFENLTEKELIFWLDERIQR